MVRGGSLLILGFVGQRSRSQLLKIEQKFDTFFCFCTISQVQETKYTHASCWEEQVSLTWGLWVKGQDHI
jgi:hypothetical protein